MLSVIQAPAITSEDLEKMKTHLRIDHDEEDDLIKSLMNATREYAEKTLCWRTFEKQTLKLTRDMTAQKIKLPMPPFIKVVEVKVIDGETITLDESDYEVVSEGEEASVRGLSGGKGKVEITYQAGYENPPEEYRLWQRMMVAHYYENRQAILPLGHNIMKTSFVADYLLQGYRAFGQVID